MLAALFSVVCETALESVPLTPMLPGGQLGGHGLDTRSGDGRRPIHGGTSVDGAALRTPWPQARSRHARERPTLEVDGTRGQEEPVTNLQERRIDGSSSVVPAEAAEHERAA